MVKEAIQAVKALDQPLMIGKNSLAYRPAYAEVSELANDLVRVLTTEGYAASTAPPYGSILILPFEKQQKLMLFANDRSVLDHALDWAQSIDSDVGLSVENGFFTYEAINSTAEHIARVVSTLEGRCGA